MYSLLFVGVGVPGCVEDESVVSWDCDCSSSETVVSVVADSELRMTLGEDSSKEGTMTGRTVSSEGLSVVDSDSLLMTAVSTGAGGGMACVAVSIAVGRSFSSLWDG